MRYLSSLFLVLLLIAACGETTKADTEKQTETSANEDKVVVTKVRNPRTFGGEKSETQKTIEAASSSIQGSEDKRLGYWVGSFGKNKINLTITDIRDGNMQGYSVCAGNFRPLQGTIVKQEDGTFEGVLKEPGDDPYDGTFNFVLDPKNDVLTGRWAPFKSEGNTPKAFTLVKRDWKYNADAGDYAFASKDELYQEDLMMEYSKEELSLIRNEIYARHGYCFKKKDFRYHFEEKSWYIPVSVDVRDQLTDLEVQNIELIYGLEEYYDEYYDDFGR